MKKKKKQNLKVEESKVEELNVDELQNISGNKIVDTPNLEIIQMDNILKIHSKITNKDIYMKLGTISTKFKNKKVILISYEPIEGTFNLFINPSSTIKKEVLIFFSTYAYLVSLIKI